MNYNGQQTPRLNGKNKTLGALSRRTFLMFCAFCILVSLWIANDYQQPYLYHNLMSSTFDDGENSKDVKEWRGATEKLCQAIVEQPSTSEQLRVQAKEVLEVEAIKRFELPRHGNVRGEIPIERKKYEKCRHAFIDLGTNIGDSIGYFVDGALDVCTPIWKRKFPRSRVNEQFPHPHLDVANLEIHNKGSGVNPLMGMMRKYMTADPPMLPEDTCVYGMEGNPTFTERLKKLENFIMDMKPRPVRHLHIHTETVVTEEDKPTTLYLDKTSVENNFWGSSILSSQQDAVKTAKELNGGQSITANVNGLRLTTLVKNTMLPYQPDATEDDKKGGRLIIKMDVEGAEYQIIKEIASSNVLCDYISMGNKVVMIVEMHHMSITDAKERMSQKNGFQQAKKKLEECGVVFGKLHAYWN
ncbi:unnamed protein product [Cylindrotheca closterium]|uniref:Methyltransferase FkbM domain-containing protein n=1 Tax=Cylindrotheca closterium TaxID=2856 RepID=A0AAD2FMF3_9STRA|nr:unnamed protein product [Cylindrotheca closterium]